MCNLETFISFHLLGLNMTKIKYPVSEEIIEFNKLVLKEIKVKKADKPELLSYKALVESINACEKTKGNVYDKATALLKNLIQNTLSLAATGEQPLQ